MYITRRDADDIRRYAWVSYSGFITTGASELLFKELADEDVNEYKICL